MRVEPFTVGDFVHVFNRGNRKMPIFRDVNDKWRFLKILRFFNDEYLPLHPFQEINKQSSKQSRFDVDNIAVDNIGNLNPLKRKSFKWPSHWPAHDPLVKILSYKLRENHFHLLLKEIKNGRISRFMKRLGNGYTKFFNLKYEEVGKVFQGSYRGKTISEDMKNLHYIDAYIQVFNSFEEYPDGIERVLKEFEKAFEFALRDPFSSIGESFGKRDFNIIDRDILAQSFPNLQIYKEFVKDALLFRNIREILGKLTIE